MPGAIIALNCLIYFIVTREGTSLKIIIIGIGKIGGALTAYLAKENHNIIAIDINPDVLEETVNTNDVMGVADNGITLLLKKDKTVSDADIVIATTSSDEKNMLCCMLAKKCGAKRAIARIRDPEYSIKSGLAMTDLGIDLIVNPEYETAREIGRMIKFPSATKVDSFAHGRVDLTEMKIPDGSMLDGVRVMALQKLLGVKILVCAVQRKNDVFIPNGTFVLATGDRIHFIAPHDQVNNFFKSIRYQAHKLKKIILFGGGKISYYLAKQLSELGFSITIVEKDEKTCIELSEKLNSVNIIHGDATDTDLLDEENFESYDASVALTGIDEENIIISLYAKQKEIGKIITKVNMSNLTEILDRIDLDSVVSPKKVTPSIILSYIRGLSNASGGSVKTLYKIVHDKVEAIEFFAFNNSKLLGKTLREVNLKSNILIACITRNSEIIIPHGDDMIMAGDNVIVVTTMENLSSLDDILA